MANTTIAGLTTITGANIATDDRFIVRDTSANTDLAITAAEMRNMIMSAPIVLPTTISVNTSSNALRITQTGSGNALVVEDSTNPDATPFVVNANGDVGVGTTAPVNRLHTVVASATTNATIFPVRVEAQTSGTPAIGIGTGIALATETATGDNVEIGATIESVATNVTNGAENFDLVFKTMSGGATAVERLRISSAGVLTTTNNVIIAGIASVNSGTLSTTATTFNAIDTTATTVNAFRAATALNIGYNSTAASTTNIVTGATNSGQIKVINIGTGGVAGSTTNILIGSTGGGTTTIQTPSLAVTGTIISGTWNGGVVSSVYGGTGVNNGGRTITLGGNIVSANSVTTSGNFALTLTTTAATNVTLPTTGTLSTLAGTETLTNKTINLANNMLTGTMQQFSSAVSNGILVALSNPATFSPTPAAPGSVEFSTSNTFVVVTPNTSGTYRATVPPVGTVCYLMVRTSGTTSFTLTFGDGFRSTGTLETGTVTGKHFTLGFISNGVNMIEISRTAAT